METEKRTYRKYDKEFKKNAVDLIINGGKTVAEVARNLGMKPNLLHRWKKEYLGDAENCYPGKGHLKPLEEENRRLKKELSDAIMERDILKKALAVFSRNQK